MSFYRSLIVAVATIGLSSAVFALDSTTTTTTTGDDTGTYQQATTTTTDTQTVTKVDLNTASTRELMTIKGINSSRAKAIVSYRQKHGNFTSTDQLREVKGFKKMNEKKLQTILNQLTTG